MRNKSIVGILLLVALMMTSMGLVAAQDDSGAVTAIRLSDGGITVDGEGVVVADDMVTITAAGSYRLSGTLSEGQVIVNTADAGVVSLSLDGVELSSSTSTPLYIEQAEAAVLSLAEGTQNGITSSAAYVDAEEALNAAIYSTADLTIEGSGSLTVEASAVDGIASAASLTIDGTPTLAVDAGDDAIQVQTVFILVDGTLNLVAGGGIAGTLADDLSGKGIKAEEQIVIENGTLTIDAYDDAIRSEQDLVMNAGTLVIQAIGKAIHASYNLDINAGSITILTCDEGIEGGFITINGGSIHIVATDDGINVSEPDDIPAPLLYYLYIHDGYIVVDAAGDGIDSNGSIEMTGGVVIVNGPTLNDNGALDYDGVFNISGGILIAAGSAGMPAAPRETSSQYAVLINFDHALEADTLVHIQSSDGEELLTFAPSKTFQSIVFSSPDLVEGGSYSVYTGGSSDGSTADGLYSDGTYTPGVEQASFSAADPVTQVGNVQGPRGGRP